MSKHDEVAQLISDLHWQIDHMRPRGIKDRAGNPYNPSYYKRGLAKPIESGDDAVVAYIAGYLAKDPSDGFKKLLDAKSLDLACEDLIADPAKPYAALFSPEERAQANARLEPYRAELDARKQQERARIDAFKAKYRREGVPANPELEASLRNRQPPRA